MLLGTTTLFGTSNVEQLSTLNWRNYSNGSEIPDRPWWTVWVDVIINISPALDVTSIFSITAANTADNIIALQFQELRDYVVDFNSLFKTRCAILLITILFPIYFYDLGIIFAYSGVVNVIFLMTFVFMFGISSLILVPQKCYYDNFLATHSVLIFLLFFSIIFLPILCLSLVCIYSINLIDSFSLW